MAEKYRYLTLNDRRQIAEWYSSGDKPADIAARLGVHTATIYRELQQGFTGEMDGPRPAYDPEVAAERVKENIARRGKSRVYRPPAVNI